VSSGGFSRRAAACVCASNVEELAAAVACGCFGKELAAEPVSNGVFVNVWWQNGTCSVVDVVDPLVVDLWVPEFVNAINVIRSLLVDLFLVEVPGSCIVRELTQKVLCFVSGAGRFVVWVSVGSWVMLV
jgi:hypothetical protein